MRGRLRAVPSNTSFRVRARELNQIYRLNCLLKDSKKLSAQLLNLVKRRLDLLPLFRARVDQLEMAGAGQHQRLHAFLHVL